jgi:aminopeptidase N
MKRALTLEEARERASLLTVSAYDVHLDLRDTDGFTSTTRVRFDVARPGATTFLELDAELVSLSRGGTPVTPEVDGNRVVLRELAAHEDVAVVARCRWSTTGEGMQRSTDPADGEVYVYSQAFLDDAQQLLACFDQPDLKAPLTLTVDAPPHWVVLSTTAATVTAPGRHEFAPTPPLPTYLFCVAAGPWHGVTTTHDGIELSAWCRQSVAPVFDGEEVLALTARCLDLQQELLGRYPFGDRYAQVFAPDFIGGAMENPALVTLSEERYVPRGRVTEALRRERGEVIAHELSHMWFGDLVTMRWWDDLWLNEAFAELMGYLTCDRALPFDDVWADFGLTRKAWGYRADSYPTTHPVAGEVADTRAALLNFDGIAYAKGASVLRQLMVWVGEDAFFAAVRDHVSRHAWGNATLADLLASLERSSGRDLGDWAQRWLRTPGFATLRVEDGAVLQEGAVLLPHRTGIGVYDDKAGALVLRSHVDVDVDGPRTEVSGVSGAALVLPNRGDLTFAAVRFDSSSLDALRRGLGTLADPLDRVVAWGGLWDSCRSAELAAADFVEVVVGHLGAESDPALVQTLLVQAGTAAVLYSADPDLLADLHEAVLRLLALPDLDGDLQLALLRGAADTSTGPEPLLGWLDRGDLPTGAVLDADLRWYLLRAGASVGAVDEQRVLAELAADRTDAGERGAGAARAALPDPIVKAAVWEGLMHDPAVSAPKVRAVGPSFWQSHQDLGVFVDRYFDELPAVFATRSPAVGPSLARHLYPRTVVDQDVLDRTDGLLARDLPPALRRTVLEVRDDLARAVAARAMT